MISSTSNKPSQAGFTLVEIIVTMAIMVMLATATYLSIHSLSADQSITNAQNVVRAALVLARNNANTGHKCCLDQLPNGYGVNFTAGGTQFYIYADLDNNYYYSTGDTVIGTTTLDSNVAFVSAGDVLFTTGNTNSVWLNGTVLTADTIIALDYTPTGQPGQVTVYYSTAVIE